MVFFVASAACAHQSFRPSTCPQDLSPTSHEPLSFRLSKASDCIEHLRGREEVDGLGSVEERFLSFGLQRDEQGERSEQRDCNRQVFVRRDRANDEPALRRVRDHDAQTLAMTLGSLVPSLRAG
jgi:hypothetical protein